MPEIDDQVPHGLVSFRRVLFQRFLDDGPERERTLGRERIGGPMLDPLQHLQRRPACERLAPGHQLVEDHAEREDVAACVNELPGGLLGRHVGHGAHHRPGPRAGHRLRACRGVGVVEERRQAEIRQLRVAVLRDEHIFGLDVAVQDPGGMCGCQAVGHAGQDLDDLTPRASFRVGPVLEGAAVHELGHEVLAALELANVVHGQNVRVIERRGRLCFALEPAAPRGVGNVLGEKFDSDRTLQLRVEGAIDNAHAAFAERRDDFILPDPRAGADHRCRCRSSGFRVSFRVRAL